MRTVPRPRPAAVVLALASVSGPVGLAALGLAALGLASAGCASRPAAAPHTLWYATAAPGEVAELDPLLSTGMDLVADALGVPWQRPVTVTITADRAAFDASLPAAWRLAPTGCELVARGAAEALFVLAPRAWSEQACGHDAADREHVALVLRHELVHALHGQHNPRPDVAGMQELAWFVEGLATFASGQLEQECDTEARRALAAGQAPARLADAWSGEFRRGVCGSLVAYLDAHCGPDTLQPMLGATTQAELLALAGLNEEELLADWAAWVAP
jgi:hypothetical protein